jgi:alpha-tubulin suppressor-like RCC1 family protein
MLPDEICWEASMATTITSNRSQRHIASVLALMLGMGMLLAMMWPVSSVQAAVGARPQVVVAVGALHACGLRQDGVALCWGNNEHGQLDVPDGERFIALTAGAYFSCGLRDDGRVRCWGDNGAGQASAPTNDLFLAVSAGYAHACGLHADGSAVCWGDAGAGQTAVPVGERFTALAPGLFHTCGLHVDGSVSCWGDNTQGQATPPPGDSFTMLAAGNDHTCGLHADGSATCWGANGAGQATVPAGSTFSVLAAGATHTCGVRSDGTMLCWGDDSFGKSTGMFSYERFIALAAGENLTCGLLAGGQLRCWGLASDSAALAPAGTSFTAVAVGGAHSCGLKTDGSVQCWGDNSWQQTVVPVGARFTKLVAGSAHTCGLRSDGTALCWGRNDFGQATMPATARFSALAAGIVHTCGLRTDGRLLCWGDNFAGQLEGSGTAGLTRIAADGYRTCGLTSGGAITCWGEVPQNAPRVPYPTGTVFVGLAMGYDHTCGLRADGSVLCFGLDEAGQSTPPAAEHFQSLVASSDHACGLRADGTVLCWGAPSDAGAMDVPAGSSFTSIATGGATCGRRSDGSLACWGDSSPFQSSDGPYGLRGGSYGFGMLDAGDYHTCNRNPQGRVLCWPFGTAVGDDAPTGQFAQVASGGFHGCTLRADGVSQCWGDDNKGQLDAPPGATFLQLDAGFWHTCGLRPDGSLICWGWNDNGQATPPPGVYRDVAAGFVHSCAVRPDGTAECWGYDGDGEIDVPAGNTFRSVGAGDRHSCGLKTDGTLVCWGDNRNGQAAPPAGTFVALAVSSFHNCAIRDTGALVCWGDNGLGQATPPAGTFVAVTGGYQHSCAIRSDGTRTCWGDSSSGLTPEVSMEPETLPVGRVGSTQSYQVIFELVSDTPQYLVPTGSVFAMVAGSLPPGLLLDGSQLYGLPTASGIYALTLEGRDANGFAARRVYQLEIKPADTTPPVITPQVAGTLGANDWYVGDVAVNWSIVENESEILSSSGCDGTVLDTDTTGTDYTCETSSEGGNADRSITIMRDATAPDTSISSGPAIQSPPGEVAFDFGGTDATAGVATFACSLDGTPFAECTSPVVVTVAAGAHTFSVRAVDLAGNQDLTPATYAWTAQQGDVTAPIASPVLTPAANSNGWYRQNVTVTWNWSDAGSGIDSNQCATQTISSGEGLLTLTASCRDVAGNTRNASVQVRVDRTAPGLAPSVSPAKILLSGTATASAGGSDALSGIDTQRCDPLSTGTVGTKTITCTVTDKAGNKATAKATYRVIYGFTGFAAPVGNPPVVNLLRNTAIAPLRWHLSDANGVAIAGLKSASLSSAVIACPADAPQRISVFGTSTKLVNLGNGDYEFGWKPAKTDVGKCRRLNLSIGDGESYPALLRID